MANTFEKTSFIPQKSLASSKVRKRKSVSLLFVTAVLLFIASIAMAIGVVGYKKVIESGNENKAISLQKEKDAFDPGLIDDLTRLNNRIESAQRILDSHIVITPLLGLIEAVTLHNVRFSQFEFTVRDSGTIALVMTGQAVDYATVVSQSDLFGQNRFLKDQIFSNINLDESGNVGFTLNALVDPSVVSFRSNTEGF